MATELDHKTLAGLIALVAHDLRSPLTALQSNLDFASREIDKPGPYAREALQDGLLSCDSFAHVIENCDLLVMVLNQQAPPPLGSVSIGALLDHVANRCSSVATSYGQTIHMRASDELRALDMRSEADMLGRALVNLVRNAAQHSPPNAGVIVTAECEGDVVELCVQDQGALLPAALRELAFTAEGQLSEALHRNRYGRGMGLYCAQVAALRCGARLQIVDRPEAKNTFSLQLARGTVA
jgi:signal transduction histidine kinase